MNLYKYRYVDSSGMTLRGTVKAKSKTEALSSLSEVVELQYFKDCGTVVEIPQVISKHLKPSTVKPALLASFFDQLSYMISAGISIPQSLLIQRASSTGQLEYFIRELMRHMSQGKSFAQSYEECAFLTHENFSKFIYVGEKGGNLDEILSRLSEQIKSNLEIKRKVKSALMYPVGVILITFAAAYFIFTTIVPQIVGILEDLGDGELPLLTKITMSISDFLVDYGPLAIIILVSFVLLIRWAINRYFRYQFDYFCLKLPLFGKIIRNGQFIDFYQNLSFMLDAGFSPSESFKASHDSITNRYLSRQLSFAYEEIIRGRGLPQALSTLECITPLEIQTLNIGFSTGRIGELIGKLIYSMKRQMEAMIKDLLTALEPALMVVLAFIVGTLLLAVYGPMFSIMTV